MSRSAARQQAAEPTHDSKALAGKVAATAAAMTRDEKLADAARDWEDDICVLADMSGVMAEFADMMFFPADRRGYSELSGEQRAHLHFGFFQLRRQIEALKAKYYEAFRQ